MCRCCLLHGQTELCGSGSILCSRVCTDGSFMLCSCGVLARLCSKRSDMCCSGFRTMSSRMCSTGCSAVRDSC